MIPIGSIVELKRHAKRYYGGRATVVGHGAKKGKPYLVKRWPGDRGHGREIVAVSRGEFNILLLAAAPQQSAPSGVSSETDELINVPNNR